MKKVTVHTPATIANLVCGFDILGLCLDDPFDTMEVTLLDHPDLVIHHKGNFVLPADPQQNTAGAPLIEIMNAVGNIGFDVIIQKNIKPGSGLGSSAANAAGAAVAANALLGNIFTNEDLVRFAMFGEKV